MWKPGKELKNERSTPKNQSSDLRKVWGVFLDCCMLSVACFYPSVIVLCAGKPAEFKRTITGWTSWFEWKNFIKSGHRTLFNV